MRARLERDWTISAKSARDDLDPYLRCSWFAGGLVSVRSDVASTQF